MTFTIEYRVALGGVVERIMFPLVPKRPSEAGENVRLRCRRKFGSTLALPVQVRRRRQTPADRENTVRVRSCNHTDRFENSNVSGFGYLVFSPPAPADDMVNGFREMDARSPTHELYLTQNQKST